MKKPVIILVFLLFACDSADKNDQSAQAIDLDQYESSGTGFYIPESELSDVKQAALDGDNEQLQRLIDFYMFSHEPQDKSAGKSLQEWQKLGAERGLKAARYNLLFTANEEIGPSCSEIERHFNLLSTPEQKQLREHSSYIGICTSK